VTHAHAYANLTSCVCVCVCVSVWVVGGCACVAYSRVKLVREQRRRFMPLDERRER
jgi:hypothetical protein